MKIPSLLAAACAVLLAAGCAHEEQHAQYGQNASPDYSSGRIRDYNDAGAKNAASFSGTSTQVIGNNAAGKTGSESDNTIVTAVRESLERNVEIAPMVPNIQINANNGSVVLNGTVQSPEQKRQVGDIARNVEGVVAVNNQLKPLYDPTAPRPSSENQPANPLLNENAVGSSTNQGDSTNGLSPTSAPDGSDKNYQQDNPAQNGQVQNTNGNQMP